MNWNREYRQACNKGRYDGKLRGLERFTDEENKNVPLTLAVMNEALLDEEDLQRLCEQVTHFNQVNEDIKQDVMKCRNYGNGNAMILRTIDPYKNANEYLLFDSSHDMSIPTPMSASATSTSTSMPRRANAKMIMMKSHGADGGGSMP